MDETEANVVYTLIDNPSLVTAHRIDPAWFTDGRLSAIVNFLNDRHGQFKGFVEVRNEFIKKFPNLLNSAQWEWLSDAQSDRYQFEGYLKTLRINYNYRQAYQAAMTFGVSKSEKALEEAKKAFAALDEPESKPIETTKDLSDHMDYLLTHAAEEGIKTYRTLDGVLNHGLRGGNLFVIGARPSVGKSAFSLNLLKEAHKHDLDLTSDLFSLEMPNGENFKRLISSQTKVPLSRLYNPVNLKPQDKDAIRACENDIQAWDYQPYDNYYSLEDIIRQIRLRAGSAKQGHYIAVIDYLQLIETHGQDQRYLQIGAITRQLKQLTNELDIPIILLSQLSRGIEARQDKRPTLSDLRESGSIEQDANVVGFLYRDDPEPDIDSDTIFLDIQKNREGQLRRMRFEFKKGIQDFREVYAE